jgi:hypothetical protein
MAGSRMDLMELNDMGVHPFAVKRKYYFARGPQLINRVVDISGVLREKTEALLCNHTPVSMMAGTADAAGMRKYVEGHFINGQKPFMGLTHYEAYRYIGAD